jgi:hypothetical protein
MKIIKPSCPYEVAPKDQQPELLEPRRENIFLSFFFKKKWKPPLIDCIAFYHPSVKIDTISGK